MKNILLLMFLGVFYCQDEYIVTVAATSYSDWIYFSIEQNSVVDIEDPNNSLDWDLAFQRKHIRTNSGLSGSGNGGGYVDSTLVWTENWGIDTLPDEINYLEDIEMYDFYDLQTHTFVEGIKNPALNAWGWFNDSYQLVPTNYFMLARCANGIDVIKIWIYDYYENNAGGNVSFRYQTGFSYESPCDGNLGDINGDLEINVVDIVNLVSYILGAVDFDSCQLILADFNYDNVVNVVDIVNIVSIILN